ncbi:cytochrome c [Uruburuella testudinis]|uniref:Cytochrome c n=1 Tax=Uruburuella testudinis TaxID=1282863 RepID=A0ABY4E097_9NEIS|nr:cytochrome c [Uruburuella testudinis]UOO83247.1 cytochrome c [Uruburuella testudinis]
MKTTLAVAASAAVLALSACGGSAAGAGKGPNSEERTTAFKAMMPNFSSMGKMVKGEEPYEVEKFKTAAAAFAEESKKPFAHFERDALVDGKPQDGDALPAVWEKPEEFKAAEETFHAAVAELNTQAQSGNLEAIKVAYGDAGASCKACHDSFRRPK